MKRRGLLGFCLVLGVGGLLLAGGYAHEAENRGEPPAEPVFEYPLIKGHGGIVPVVDGKEMPQPDSKLLIDLTTGTTKEELNSGLDKVARFVNLYAGAGVKGDQVRFAVVVHGDATSIVIDNQKKNPNLPLIQTLRKEGVEFFVCAQALAHHGYHPEQVTGDVAVAYSALTALVNHQHKGYAYIPLK